MSPCDELVDRPEPVRLALRLPRVRFTLSRMMIAVAIVAMVLGLAVTVQRRRERFERLAAYHSDQCAAWSDEALKGVTCLMGFPATGTDREEVERFTNAFGTEAGLAKKRALEHKHLYEAYLRAARRPWFGLVLRSPEP
jgi:hypothetical protein